METVRSSSKYKHEIVTSNLLETFHVKTFQQLVIVYLMKSSPNKLKITYKNNIGCLLKISN